MKKKMKKVKKKKEEKKTYTHILEIDKKRVHKHSLFSF
jgi:hypothetical protein